MDSSNAKAHFRRGCALESLERFAEAAEAYEKALCYEPADSRIRSALTRSARYLQFSQGPERAARIERAAREKNLKGKSSLPPPKKVTPTKCGGCCRCSDHVNGEGYFAVPCAHGPYCGQCKASIDREGNGLPLCMVCMQHPAIATRSQGLIERWEVGLGEPVYTQPAKEAVQEALSSMRPWAFGEEAPTNGEEQDGHKTEDAAAPMPEATPLSCMD